GVLRTRQPRHSASTPLRAGRSVLRRAELRLARGRAQSVPRVARLEVVTRRASAFNVATARRGDILPVALPCPRWKWSPPDTRACRSNKFFLARRTCSATNL